MYFDHFSLPRECYILFMSYGMVRKVLKEFEVELSEFEVLSSPISDKFDFG